MCKALEPPVRSCAVKKVTRVLIVALTVSVLSNAYLLKLVINWQEAWLEQILTTTEVERLYRKSEADTTLEAIKEILTKESVEYELVPVVPTDIFWDKGDKKVLLVNGTRLYFNDGQYIGSKANLPNDLSHWVIGQEK
jgi:hypothetical protein